jgi:predicted RNA binding protein YcfA (HicA-like mRNA interferase family)
MGTRRYPPLTPSEVVAILRALGFSLKRQDGSHAQYERGADGLRERALVTVDMAVTEFWEELMRSMIRQSRFSREEFYGATKQTAKKIQLKKKSS